MKPTILITGGTGAIGSALSRQILSETESDLVILDDYSSSNPALVQDIVGSGRVQFIEGSVTDDVALLKAFAKKPGTVFHLAANFANQNSVDHPIRDTEVNSIGTIKVLEQSRLSGVEKFVFASSSCVYGNATSFAVDTRDFHLDTPYAVNKLHGEYLAHFYHDYHDMNVTVLRYFNSFGPGELPGQYRNVVPNFFALAMQGKPLPITGNANIARDFNYVENTIRATLLAAESQESKGRILNIGSGQETKIVDLASMINDITGNTAGIVMHEARSWDTIERRCADISETEKVLGYTPIIDLRKQLESTYEWLQRYQILFLKSA
ncbi:MAG: NAD-dependent epimerase/dehydratase family protein [Candidatus Peribacteraceae bacterium]